MSGYNGYSMSNNAVMAYDNDLKPLSKWTKDDILEAIEDDEIRKLAENYSLKVLKDVFLYYKEWHHTSKYYNKTEFYGLRTIDVEKDDVKKLLDRRKEYFASLPKKKKDDSKKLVYISYHEWQGTRRHPKKVYFEDYAIIYHNQAYLGNGKTKRSYSILKEFNRAPKGTKKLFDFVRKDIKG